MVDFHIGAGAGVAVSTDEVRLVPGAVIGDGCGEIGKLQRGDSELSLADSQTHEVALCPSSLTITLVVVFA